MGFIRNKIGVTFRRSVVLRFKLVAIFAIAATAAGGAIAYFQEPLPVGIPPYVVAGESVYLLLPPQPVAGDQVDSLNWSPTGDYLLVTRTKRDTAGALRDIVRGEPSKVERRQSLVLYDLKRAEGREVWSGNPDDEPLDQIAWITGTNSFTFVAGRNLRTVDPTRPSPSEQALYLVDAGVGKSKLVMRLEQEGGLPALVTVPSPVKDYTLLTVVFASPNALRATSPGGSTPTATRAPLVSQHSFLYANGETSKPVKIDPDAVHGGWRSSDGAPFFDQYVREDGGRPKFNRYVLDPKTNQLEAASNLEEWRPARIPGPIVSMLVPTSGDMKSAELVSSSEESKALIAADASTVSLSPTRSGVAYITDGVAVVRRLLEVPKRAFLQAVVEAERRRAVNNAKMAGLAALMYGADYDDSLPGQGFDMRYVLSPYAKDSNVLKDLVYTFSGGNLADVKDPASTELGFVAGPGGKAVVYLDGHVVWVPDKS